MSDSSIILFDGHCNLCNRWVDFVIKRDPKKKFRFVAQQSHIGQQILRENGALSKSGNSILLIREGKILDQSTAVLQILKELQSPLRHLHLLEIFPRFLRDFLYNTIAKNRYRIFGRREICRLSDAENKHRFL